MMSNLTKHNYSNESEQIHQKYKINQILSILNKQSHSAVFLTNLSISLQNWLLASDLKFHCFSTLSSQREIHRLKDQFPKPTITNTKCEKIIQKRLNEKNNRHQSFLKENIKEVLKRKATKKNFKINKELEFVLRDLFDHHIPKENSGKLEEIMHENEILEKEETEFDCRLELGLFEAKNQYRDKIIKSPVTIIKNRQDIKKIKFKRTKLIKSPELNSDRLISETRLEKHIQLQEDETKLSKKLRCYFQLKDMKKKRKKEIDLTTKTENVSMRLEEEKVIMSKVLKLAVLENLDHRRSKKYIREELKQKSKKKSPIRIRDKKILNKVKNLYKLKKSYTLPNIKTNVGLRDFPSKIKSKFKEAKSCYSKSEYMARLKIKKRANSSLGGVKPKFRSKNKNSEKYIMVDGKKYQLCSQEQVINSIYMRK